MSEHREPGVEAAALRVRAEALSGAEEPVENPLSITAAQALLHELCPLCRGK